MIKLATHGRDMRKDVINKYVKTTNYNTVAFNAVAVAIGYTISLNYLNHILSTLIMIMKFPANLVL
ncbi:MAG: hypothetical protein ISS63_15150 [Desulfobacteraceae bacterium]|nr:hypothetical protein [Desulfobacteraceae bacterium]